MENTFDHYKQIVEELEKEKKRSQVVQDHLKANQLKYNTQLDYQKNNPLRRERTHRLIQKGALFEKYIEEHVLDHFLEPLKPEETEILLTVFSDILKKNKPYIMNQWKIKKESQPAK